MSQVPFALFCALFLQRNFYRHSSHCDVVGPDNMLTEVPFIIFPLIIVDDVYEVSLLTLNWYPDILKVQDKKYAFCLWEHRLM